MSNFIQRGRLIFLAVALGVGFLALIARLVDLQVVRHDEFRQKALKQHTLKVLKQSPRGDIRDRNGQILATTVAVKTVCVDPVLLTNYQRQVAQVLSPLLNVPEPELLKSFRNLTRLVTNENKVKVITNHSIVLQRNVSTETWTNLEHKMFENYLFHSNAVVLQKQAALNVQKPQASWRSWLPGRGQPKKAKLNDRDKLPLRNAWLNAIYAEDDQLRQYPHTNLAAHVIGFTLSEPQNIMGHIIPRTTGAQGIEASFDERLTGQCGWRVGRTDGRHRELVVYRELNVEPSPGLNVVLTLDSFVQYVVEEELARVMAKHSPRGAMAIVMRPATGEILALANLPVFDPNNIRTCIPDNLRNRAIEDCAEPGSTFKIVTVSCALNDNLITLSDHFDCEGGRFLYAGKVLRDHAAYHSLSVEDIVAKSSNIGTAKIAIMMGEQRFYQYIRASGFGSRTGIPLTGESAGIVNPLEKWSKLSIARVPIGQGVAATPLQMVLAMCTIANGGTLMRPMLVDRIEDKAGHVVNSFQPTPVHRVISERAAHDIIVALKEVVSKNGTADKAALEGYSVAGKTGTAQKPGHGGYLEGKYFASFIGFFPSESPELCIGVFVDEPDLKTGYYGGQVAAPAFKHIGQRLGHHLNIRPDVQPASGVTNAGVAVFNNYNPLAAPAAGQ